MFICLSSNFGSLSYLQPFVNNFFISFLLSVSVATFIYYHICYCLSTTFSTHFSELSHRFPRWTFNISLLSQLVKGICAIFLYNFQLYFHTTKCTYFFFISLCSISFNLFSYFFIPAFLLNFFFSYFLIPASY